MGPLGEGRGEDYPFTAKKRTKTSWDC
ncbi:uncharacterized protein G2W53_002294 [Senna tora]|uniref:Uncharacterized protein n=1 Tax=Senna tora TaxID=362788 RepID=A0A834XJN1_9FABA|nr:uncharacterized protein G2W53_002294 [Senna tora]